MTKGKLTLLNLSYDNLNIKLQSESKNECFIRLEGSYEGFKGMLSEEIVEDKKGGKIEVDNHRRALDVIDEILTITNM